MGGWIKLYDKMLDWEWYGNTNVVRVFLHCLLKANYQQRVWQGVTIERGQFITSVASMSAELGLSPKQVRGALMKLERANNLAIKGTNKYSVITICNYDIYQSSPDTKGQTKGQTTGKPKGEQQGNSNRYIDNTEEQNKNTTPKGDSKKFRKPSIEEIRDYILEYGCYWVDAERFFDYYESNGWKVGRNAMKDWKATIRTWANKDKKVNGEIDLNAEIKYLEQERERMRRQNEEQRKLNL